MLRVRQPGPGVGLALAGLVIIFVVVWTASFAHAEEPGKGCDA